MACVWRPLSNTVYATASTWANTIVLVAIEIKFQQYRHVYLIGTNVAGRHQFSNSTSNFNSHCFIFFRFRFDCFNDSRHSRQWYAARRHASTVHIASITPILIVFFVYFVFSIFFPSSRFQRQQLTSRRAHPLYPL